MVGDMGNMSVLFVCHGNLCRSPLAERLAEAVFAPLRGPDGNGPGAGHLTFGSAGTHAYTGDPMHRHTVRVLAEHGASTRRFSSRRVDPSLLTDAGLVLTATREQRAYCVRLAPPTVRRTFTIREFGRLCGAVDPAALHRLPSAPARMRALVDGAVVARARFQPVPARDDDLTDPVNRPVDEFRACADRIRSTLDAISGLITAARATAHPPRQEAAARSDAETRSVAAPPRT